MRHSRPATTVREANKRPPFRLRFRLCFDIFSLICFDFCFIFGVYCRPPFAAFLMWVRHLTGSLSCLATAMAATTATTSTSGSGLGNGLQFYFGDVTNAISVSHMCKNVFRFMRVQHAACLALMPSDSQAQRGPQDCSLAVRAGAWSCQEGGNSSHWLSELRICRRTLAACACFEGRSCKWRKEKTTQLNVKIII